MGRWGQTCRSPVQATCRHTPYGRCPDPRIQEVTCEQYFDFFPNMFNPLVFEHRPLVLLAGHPPYQNRTPKHTGTVELRVWAQRVS